MHGSCPSEVIHPVPCLWRIFERIVSMQAAGFLHGRAVTPCQAATGCFLALHIWAMAHRFLQNSRGRPRQTKDKPMEAFGQFIPLILIFVIMYFLLIRPQQKKVKDHQAMVAALRRGDEVVTQGGLIGKVVKVKDNNELEVELAEGVKVRVVQSTVAQVTSKTEPVKS
jgi:preprotein translocase subunit YajC